jgi:hypothetical protein
VRLRLWTTASNGPLVNPSGDKWAWRTMVTWWCRERKTPDSSTRAVWQSYRQIHLVAKQEEVTKEMNIALRSISFILRRALQNAAKSYDMGSTALLPLWRKACCGVLWP